MKRGSVDANMVIAGILRAGSAASAVLMAAGLFLFLLKSGGAAGLAAAKTFDMHRVWAAALRLDPVALITLGILILVLTPFLRVAGAVFIFWFVDKDLKYALISLVVLLILMAALFVPGIG